MSGAVTLEELKKLDLNRMTAASAAATFEKTLAMSAAATFEIKEAEADKEKKRQKEIKQKKYLELVEREAKEKADKKKKAKAEFAARQAWKKEKKIAEEKTRKEADKKAIEAEAIEDARLAEIGKKKKAEASVIAKKTADIAIALEIEEERRIKELARIEAETEAKKKLKEEERLLAVLKIEKEKEKAIKIAEEGKKAKEIEDAKPHVKVRYLGNRFPKVVELPVTFRELSAKEGEVVFEDSEHTVMEFPNRHGLKLIKLGGVFEDGSNSQINKEQEEKEPEEREVEVHYSDEKESTEKPKPEEMGLIEKIKECLCSRKEKLSLPIMRAYVVVAHSLLSGEGLNYSSFLRGLTPKQKQNFKRTKVIYNLIMESLKDKIRKQQHDYFWKKKCH